MPEQDPGRRRACAGRAARRRCCDVIAAAPPLAVSCEEDVLERGAAAARARRPRSRPHERAVDRRRPARRRPRRRARRRRVATLGDAGQRARRAAPPRRAARARTRSRARPRSSSTVPSATSTPSRITPTRSQTCSTSPIRWLESSTVRPPLAERADERAHLGHAGRVEPVGRLVEDQQLRVLEQRGGDAEPLLHAQRVRSRSGRRRASVSPTSSSTRLDASPGHAGVAGEHAQVVAAGEVRVEGRAPRPSRRCRASPSGAPGGAPSTAASPDVGRTRPEQHPQRRRLAGAVGAEEAVDLAAAHAQVEVVDGDDRVAVALGERRASR